MATRRSVLGWAGATLLAAAAPTGCDRPGDPAPPAPAPAVTRTWRAGDASGRDALVVEAALDRTRMTVADRATFTLRIGAAPGRAAEFDPPEDRLGDLTIVSHERETGRTAGGLMWTEHRFLLEPFLAGEKTIPALRVSLAPVPAGTPGPDVSVRTEPLGLSVTSLLPEAERTALAPAKGPVTPPPAQDRGMRPLLIGAGVSAMGLAAIVGWLVWRGRARKPADPTALAHAAIAQLRDSWDAGAVGRSEGAARLAEILRGYAADRFGITAAGATTGELLAVIDGRGLATDTARDQLRAMARDLDRSRFAPDEDRRLDLPSLLDRAAAFVDATSTPPHAQPAPGGATPLAAGVHP